VKEKCLLSDFKVVFIMWFLEKCVVSAQSKIVSVHVKRFVEKELFE